MKPKTALIVRLRGTTVRIDPANLQTVVAECIAEVLREQDRGVELTTENFNDLHAQATAKVLARATVPPTRCEIFTLKGRTKRLDEPTDEALI